MTLQEILSLNIEGIPERSIVWMDISGDIMVTWNHSLTFSIWVKPFSRSFGLQENFEEEDVWTSDTEVKDYADASKRAYTRMVIGNQEE